MGSLDCYVLDTGQRVISLRATIKSIANVDSGKLGNYIESNSLKPFINSDKILGELLEFSIPGTQLKGLGLTTEHFELICRGYVQALYQNAPLTDRQREIAIKCAVLTAGLTRTGLDALSNSIKCWRRLLICWRRCGLIRFLCVKLQLLHHFCAESIH